jgi:hypothetical protein
MMAQQAEALSLTDFTLLAFALLGARHSVNW